ncbi:MAG: YqiA/YcfP family alpha/beta fold hydrolase [Patescibacteria group bacterium]
MKKVLIIHGFEGSPNGGWRPWLMGELAKHDIYACALAMPKPDEPICAEWVAEVQRHVEGNRDDEVYLVGHSLGVATILRYLESAPHPTNVRGAMLISGRCEKGGDPKIHNFFEKPFDYNSIQSKVKSFLIIHGDNDPYVPFDNAETLSKELGGTLLAISNGEHLNSESGWLSLPQCLEPLMRMIGVV